MCAVAPPGVPGMAGCMPTGSRRHRRGFSYIGLLFVIALMGAAMAAAGTAWRLAAQREQELESMFRGQQIADAIGAWRSAGAAAGAQADPAGDAGPAHAGGAVAANVAGPAQLEDLVEDRRSGVIKRHLRRVYSDPLTGQPDWLLLRNASGVIVGLRSRAVRPAVVWRGLPPAAAGRPRGVGERIYRPSPSTVPISRPT